MSSAAASNLDKNLNESFCPLCESIGNTILKILPRILIEENELIILK